MPDATKQPDANTIQPPQLTDAEREARNADIMLLEKIRAQYEQSYDELDGMTPHQYWESNAKKDLSYVAPKRNKQDVRISTGLTREKDTTLVGTALNMNFVADVTAFDSDNLMVAELGDNMSDLVKKSREIENWQKKRPIIYRELVAQGDVFLQELYIEDFREMPLEEVSWNPQSDAISDFSIRRRLQKVFSGCAVRKLDGRTVFLGDIHIEYIEDQDAVAIVQTYPRTQMERRYGSWERWKNVPKQNSATTFDTAASSTTYVNWNWSATDDDLVTEVQLFQVGANKLSIYLNGTPMLPHNFPLTAICPSGELPFAQGKLEPIPGFALSKSQPSKTKIDQEVLDEATKLMIEGMRQGRKPPSGSRGKKVHSPDIFMAGKLTPNMSKDDIFPLLQSPGLNAADFNFYQLIKQGIDEKSVNKTYEGNSQQTDTLGQARMDKEQQMLKLGLAIDGFVNLERRLTWLRIYNILQNWTKKYDPYVDPTREGIMGNYRNVSVNTTLENGQKGVKMFRFSTDQYPTLGEQQREENELSKEYAQEVRVVYMNPELLRSIKYTWFIVINPTPQSNDELTQILFVQNLEKSLQLFGYEAHNIEYLKQRYTILMNEDYNKWFKKMDIMQMMQLGPGDPAVQNARGGAPSPDQSAVGGMKAAAGGRKPLRAAVQ